MSYPTKFLIKDERQWIRRDGNVFSYHNTAAEAERFASYDEVNAAIAMRNRLLGSSKRFETVVYVVGCGCPSCAPYQEVKKMDLKYTFYDAERNYPGLIRELRALNGQPVTFTFSADGFIAVEVVKPPVEALRLKLPEPPSTRTAIAARLASKVIQNLQALRFAGLGVITAVDFDSDGNITRVEK